MKKKSTWQSAFFSLRVSLTFLLLFSAGIVLAVLGTGLFAAAEEEQAPQENSGIQFGESYHNDVSPALRDLPQVWPPRERKEGDEEMREANLNPKLPNRLHIDVPDPVVDRGVLGFLVPNIPSPILNFDGIPFPGVGCNCAPPDTNGAVGQTQYVQMVNKGYQVFSKSTGASVLGPLGIQSIWTGFGGVCETTGKGDPVVLYDHLANRWLISQFAGSPPTSECIAISTTSDATGTYNRYAFLLGTNFFDYPHLAVWPDGYYMADNVFNAAGTAFLGTQAFAFDRAKMLAGMPATFVSPGLTPGGAANEYFLPADIDGSILPTAGAPATFVEFPGGGNGNTYRTWHYHADFVTPASSTFTIFASPPAAGYTTLCPTTRVCVPQLSGTGSNSLDGIGDRLMFRLAYRKFPDGHEAVVGNYSVSAGGVAGVRWFELRNVTAGPVTVFQESTYQPDTTWRWMGSAAMDGDGNLAIGFSASSATINPQIRYAGRLVSDPLNTLAQGEATLFSGTGSQTGTQNRWGDYSSLTVDPVDDHTFWYTQEYYATTGTFNWRTRIGSFKFSTVPTSLIVSGGSSIVSAGGNGVLDPGETVTVSLGLQNIGGPGTICTTALTGTLQATGGVTSPSGPQNYGAVCSAGGPIVFRNFTFRVDPALPCGSIVTSSLAVVDGATNYGTITYTFTTGTTSTSNVQNFDGVVAPALPAGWTTTFSGTGTPVVTSTTFPDTAPNDIFLSEGSNVGLSEVTSATIAITSASQKVTFRNLFNTEAGFDGLVFEISINGGAFADILAAGGTFASGGYNSTLNTGFSNPLPGRMAWSGLSGGTAAAPTYITTVVNLPAAAAGQNIKLKWRQGSDATVVPATNPGSRIDTITSSLPVCAVPTPTPTATPLVSISGTVRYCSNPVPGPVPNVTLTRTGTTSGSTLSNASGNYTFSSLPSGGNYTVTPSKAARAPASAGIDTVDVIAAQRHFLNLGTLLTGCRLTAADVNADTLIDTFDVIAIQRFSLGQTTGIANVGKYKFTPPNRTYTGLVSNQTTQNYDTLVFGDVASSFVERVDGPSQDIAGEGASVGEVAAVVLPKVALDQSMTNFIAAVTTSAIDAKNKLVGFQGDFTFDERVIAFQELPVQNAGLTAGNWNVSGNVLPGAGPIRTLRVSAYSNDFTPLSGSGTLFELRLTRVSTATQGSQLLWAPAPDQFIFIDADLNTQKPGYAEPGSVTQSGKRR